MILIILAYAVMITYYQWSLRYPEEIDWPFATHKLYITVDPASLEDVLERLRQSAVRTTDVTLWGEMIVTTIYTPTKGMKNQSVRRVQDLDGVESVTVTIIRSTRGHECLS